MYTKDGSHEADAWVCAWLVGAADAEFGEGGEAGGGELGGIALGGHFVVVRGEERVIGRVAWLLVVGCWLSESMSVIED